MADNIITPRFRACYISVFRAVSMKQKDGTMSKAKFSVRAAFPPNTNLSELKKEAQAATVEKYGDKIPKSFRSPFRKNEELDNPVVGIGDDWIIMTFSANEDRRPGVVNGMVRDAQGRPTDIDDDSKVYAGGWFVAQVRAFCYENAGNKGVSFGLQNLMLVKDDDPIGGGRTPANKAFEAVEVDTQAESASDLFK
jgi:hypothetical protein